MSIVKARLIVIFVSVGISLATVGLLLKLESHSLRRSLAFTDFATADLPEMKIPSLSPKNLPRLHETGGLAIFLHVAKTGGTSIRSNFNNKTNFPNVDVKRVMVETALNKRIEHIDFYVSERNTENETLLLEFHGGYGQPLTIFQLHPYLHMWRSMAKANNKNVFIFTMLREPSSFYVSYFNFFKHPDCVHKWCDTPLMNLTEENLINSLVPNHQCMYLARRQNHKHVNLEFPVSASECDSVYNLLKADVDWVGTTERMQNTTLPLLSYVLAGDAERGRSFEAFNVAETHTSTKSPLKLSDLSAESLQKMRQVSELDRYMYESAARDYRLSMWENFDTR